jgi:hypothetical protein
MSVSVPDLTRSVHVGSMQTRLQQRSDAQSESDAQWRSSAHGAHNVPPQSTSVSSPFETPSVQLAPAMTLLASAPASVNGPGFGMRSSPFPAPSLEGALASAFAPADSESNP